MLIDFEGIDGSGKCTQAKMLKDKLLAENQKVELISYPKYTSKYGEIIKDFLFDNIKLKLEEQMLLYMLDMLEDRDKINDFLEEGKIVILDRYYPSTIVYQSALGLDNKTILSLVNNLSFPTPTVIINLEVTPTESIHRKLQQNVSLDKYEKDINLLERVSLEYKRLINNPIIGNRMVTINGNQSQERIHNQVIQIIKNNYIT